MTRLKDKPFALIGFNVGKHDPPQLKEIMDKEKLNWRSISDRGEIAPKWNNPGTPLYYVIDPAGIIRYKWFGYPGEQALDAAIEKQLGEIEK